MKANPGGSISPDFVLGREPLIEKIWQQLDKQCVLLNAERRIGKTSILRKMAAQPREGWFCIFKDLEKIHSAAEFATEVYEGLQPYLSKAKQLLNKAKDVYEEHDFGNIKKTTTRPWKKLLTTAIEDLATCKFDQRLVFFWDEVPYMIDNICKAEGEQVATELLDTLRSLRQEHPDLRMVFTGSIGLHHVISGLHKARIATAPVNDMFSIEVTPLAPGDARQLAKKLIKGEELVTDNLEDSADEIAEQTDYFPFYIHHIVNALKLENLPASREQIQEIVRHHLVDANDPWELGHYRERIPIYYKDHQEQQLVTLILDSLAEFGIACSFDALQSAINNKTNQFDDRDLMTRILRLMEKDHYLSRDLKGEYDFRFRLVRRWWQIDRGLST